MIKLDVTIHDLLQSKRKNSILKSMFISKKKFETDHTSVQVTIEPYDQTFLNAEESKGQDYIIDRLHRQLTDERLLNAIKKHLDIDHINGVSYSYYSDKYRPLESFVLYKHGEMITLSDMMKDM